MNLPAKTEAKLVETVAKTLFNDWVKPPKGYGKLLWQDEPITMKNIWMRRAESALAVAVPVIRNAVLEEAAMEFVLEWGSDTSYSAAAFIRAMKTEGSE